MRYFGSGIALAAIAAVSAQAQDNTDIMAGVFTGEQAARGEALYQSTCAGCHGAELVSADPDFPTLAAPAFRWSWGTKSIGEKYERIHTTMPPNAAGSFSDQEYLDIVTYILHFNGYPAGEQELTPAAPLNDIIITPQS